MEQLEAMSFEYAVRVFNETLDKVEYPHKSVQIVWNTSLGIATGDTVSYNKNGVPVLTFKDRDDFVDMDVSKPNIDGNDLFGDVRRSVISFLYNGFSYDRLILVEYPDILLNRLLELSRVEIKENSVLPTYSTIWNFKTIDKTISLPFVEGNSIKIFEPISLISEN